MLDNRCILKCEIREIVRISPTWFYVVYTQQPKFGDNYSTLPNFSEEQFPSPNKTEQFQLNSLTWPWCQLHAIGLISRKCTDRGINNPTTKRYQTHFPTTRYFQSSTETPRQYKLLHISLLQSNQIASISNEELQNCICSHISTRLQCSPTNAIERIYNIQSPLFTRRTQGSPHK